MAITIYTSDQYSPAPYRSFTFSAGEKQVRIGSVDSWKSTEAIAVEANIQGSEGAMELFMVLNALDNLDLNYPRLDIVLPYLPYSRQDRVCYPGEAFGLEAFLNILVASLPNNVKRPRLITWDVHSDVAEEICRHWKKMTFFNLQSDFLLTTVFSKTLSSKVDNLIVVAPDKGAVNRATKAANGLIGWGCPEDRILFGEKVRDPDNGEILGTLIFMQEGESSVHLLPDRPQASNLKGKPMLIVDDICDGGRTFIELAKVLRQFEPSEIILYVTHGIFSKGFEVFKDKDGKPLIDKFLISNPFEQCLYHAEADEMNPIQIDPFLIANPLRSCLDRILDIGTKLDKTSLDSEGLKTSFIGLEFP